jgi:glycine betaine/choline ABC-type transport system substrate-binding protein
MRRLLRAALAVFLASLLVACAEVGEPIRIGSQDFTEQKLLAEMMALLAEQAGVDVKRAIPYGGNRKSLEAIQRGVIDAYPAYDGTLLVLSGRPALRDPAAATAAARALVEPLGLRWLQPFGLEDGFALAVRRDMAIRRGLSRISDLARLPDELSFAVDDGYLERPVDGLYALARRYGLSIGATEVFPVRDRRAIYNALADRAVDVAEVFGTDSRLNDYGVLRLEDDLGFFPIYRPAPLVRGAVLDAFPGLSAAWAQLAGRIDTETMRGLNGRVERAGEDYRDVARAFLEEIALLPERPATAEPRGKVALAVTPLSDRGYLPIRAAEAIREVMPARRLQVERVGRPADAVRSGEARFGLVGAEEFYRVADDGSLTQAADIEAVGVVGTRLVHILLREGGMPPAQWRRIGVGPEGGSSWTVTRLVIEALGLQDRMQLVNMDQVADARRMLDDGELDALVMVVERGHAGLVNLLKAGGYRLADVAAFRGDSPALRYPFLRPAKIPGGTYPGQAGPLDTLAAQVVLATRVPRDPDPIGESGPGFVPGVFTRLPQRLPFDTALRISRALDTVEDVDPVLPISPGLAPETPPARAQISAQPASALLNMLAIAFLVAMIVLYFRRLPDDPALKAKDPPPEE